MVTVVVLTICAVGGYLISVRIHPFRRCRWCAGTGKHVGAIFTYAHRPCRHCAGSGRKARAGRKISGGSAT